MEKYLKSVQKYCVSEPILDTVIMTDEFELTVKAYQSIYSEDRKFIYWYVGCDRPWRNYFHPLRWIFKNEEGSEEARNEIWDVIADNPLVRMILNYIAMSDDELAKYCGNKHQVEYRSHLIKCLTDLWD